VSRRRDIRLDTWFIDDEAGNMIAEGGLSGDESRYPMGARVGAEIFSGARTHN
jgi:hypothetical protein